MIRIHSITPREAQQDMIRSVRNRFFSGGTDAKVSPDGVSAFEITNIMRPGKKKKNFLQIQDRQKYAKLVSAHLGHYFPEVNFGVTVT